MTGTHTPYNVLLVDDHAIFRNGFLLVLKNHITVQQAYHAADGFEALKILHNHPVDLVFLDYYMPFMNGVECMQIIKKQFPEIKVIVISMMNSMTDIITMKNSGAHALITKNFNGDELGIAISTVMEGRRYYDSYISEMLLEENPAFNGIENKTGNQALTPREKQILQMISRGEISKEIAEKLRTSQETVEKQRKNILKKIKGRGIADAIRFSIRSGIVNINEFLNKEERRQNPTRKFQNRQQD